MSNEVGATGLRFEPFNVVPPEGLKLVEAPRFSATTVSTLGTNHEIVLLFGHTIASVDGSGQLHPANTPVVQISLSPVVAKELVALLGDSVASLEKEFGALDSPYLRSRKAP